MRNKTIVLIALFACATLVFAQAKPSAPGGTGVRVISMPGAAPLYSVQIMIKAGSTNDPAGKEGTAAMVARGMLEASFGDPKNPVTKEKLAEITRPWGDAAMPSVMVDKQSTTFRMLVPRSAFQQFVNSVLKPMFTQPLWNPKEIDRIRTEALSGVTSGLRFEQQENLGLLTLDNYIFYGTPLGHLSQGTVQGLKSITADDLRAFYTQHYSAASMTVATNADAASVNLIKAAMPAGSAQTAPATKQINVAAVRGREVLIVSQPNAIATGIHFGFPITVNRGDPDYWPLYIGNAFLGQHRDSFGLLYNEIREARGYNYGDYTYTEYLAARPFSLFPPPNTPRTQQYYSAWIRPVGHQYAHFITKAATAELDRLIKNGLTPEQVAEAKIKARTLYLNFAESTERRLGYKLDDAFYGMNDRGYIDTMIARIDAVTPEQVNAAIKKHLQTANLKYVIVTNESVAQKLADDLANNTNVTSKTLEEYHISEPIPPEKKDMLARDEVWKAYPLNISRDRITIVPAAQMFETLEIPGIKPVAQK